MTEDDLADLELALQQELSCLLSMSLPRSAERSAFDRLMVQTIRDVFEKHLPTIHLVQ